MIPYTLGILAMLGSVGNEFTKNNSSDKITLSMLFGGFFLSLYGAE